MEAPVRLPVILLGGSTGPLSIARELTGRGVEVHLSLQAGRPELTTRRAAYKHPYATRDDAHALWAKLLLGPQRSLPRAVVFPCDDDAVEFVARQHAALSEHHLLDRASPEHLSAFLDKAKTAQLVQGTGVRLPRTWPLHADAQEVFRYDPPAILLKPVHSHRFQRVFGAGGQKLFVAQTPAEFEAARERLDAAQIDAIATELIPGPDDHSVTYYGYRPRPGETLFEFTKQVLRRFPRNQGPGSFHVTNHDPEINALARRLLDAVGFLGYANIEFKRDARDGLPTLIEVNPRFTASQELLLRAGIPAGWLVYQSLLGGQPAPVTDYRLGLHLWDPVRDVRAMRELRRLEGFPWTRFASPLFASKVTLLFRWSDPRPSLARLGQMGKRAFR